MGPHLHSLSQQVWKGARESTYLRSFQVMLLVLGQSPHCVRLFCFKAGICDSETQDAYALHSPPQRSLLLRDRPGRDPHPLLVPAQHLLDLLSERVHIASAGFLLPMLGTLSSSPKRSPFPLFSGSISLPWAWQLQGLGQDRSPEMMYTFQGDSKSSDQSPRGSQQLWAAGDTGHLGSTLVALEED